MKSWNQWHSYTPIWFQFLVISHSLASILFYSISYSLWYYVLLLPCMTLSSWMIPVIFVQFPLWLVFFLPLCTHIHVVIHYPFGSLLKKLFFWAFFMFKSWKFCPLWHCLVPANVRSYHQTKTLSSCKLSWLCSPSLGFLMHHWVKIINRFPF